MIENAGVFATCIGGTMHPKFTTIEGWTALSGIGRTKTYELLGEGKLRAVKAGKRLLIDVEHGLAFMAALPAAVIGSPTRR